MKRNTLVRILGWSIALATTLTCAAAQAGSRELADGAFRTVEESNYAFDGQFWHYNDTRAIGPTNGTLPLYVDFGTGPSLVHVFSMEGALGRVRFFDTLGNPTSNFFEPMHLSGPLPSGTGSYNYNPNYSNGFFTYGELDPQYLTATSFPTGPFDYSKALSAFRWTWPSQCPYSTGTCSSDDLLSFQAVMIVINATDFMLQFNYNNFGNVPPDVVTGLFQIGSSTGTYSGPFEDTGPNYCFHNATLVSCSAAVAGVPEPETMPLVALGAFAAGAAAVLRRRRSTVG